MMSRRRSKAQVALSYLAFALAAHQVAGDVRHESGRCAMYSTCGKKGIFGQDLPCPDNRPAPKVDDVLRAQLKEICGSEIAHWDRACCTSDQLATLATSVEQAEPLVATCPACSNNFRRFYCHFTCSPDQSMFVNVTQTQKAKDDRGEHDAVKALDFYVAPKFGHGFFDSCREVKFSATNGYAMDLLGGGAKTWGAFLRYMGQERPGFGSPFQINFPTADTSSVEPTPTLLAAPALAGSMVPLAAKPLSCSSVDLDARCTCTDCSDVCTELPPPPPPFITSPEDECHIGSLTCTSFVIILVYGLGLVGYLGLVISRELQGAHRIRLQDDTAYDSGGYERVSMQDPAGVAASGEDSPAPLHTPAGRAAVGSGDMTVDGARSSIASSRSQWRLGRGVGGFSHQSSTDFRQLGFQPRTYYLNTVLTRGFYRLGYFCASRPYLVIALGLIICGGLNAGWSQFQIEKDPVKLWVAKGSRSEVEKADFEARFGPFYRTEQIFLTASSRVADISADAEWQSTEGPVLNWRRLQWIASFQDDIRSLQSPSGLSLASVCFAPTADTQPPKSSSDCVVQSIMGYFGDTLDGEDEDSWADTLNDCATTPAACLPDFGQPLNPRLLLGGVPDFSDKPSSEEGLTIRASEAQAVVITFVVSNSLDGGKVAAASEWEAVLKDYLATASAPGGSAENVGLKMAWSTEISLEEELNKSTNTDVTVVVLSYLAMFFYVSINLGGSGAAIVSACWRGIKFVCRLAMPKAFEETHALLIDPVDPLGQEPRKSTSLRRRLLVESKFILALWSIFIVLLSVSTSVGLFSMIGVRITLIIAEVIPFLVLAIGVDNVFILAHELSRQNARAHGSLARSGVDFAAPDGDEEDELGGLPSAEERVARALARMGPSIFLSASCETVAFALGAIVGMPAVRNFAIYAAGAVAINTLLQITVLVSAMAIDLRRVEANRVDCFPCAQLPGISSADMAAAQGEGNLSIFIRTVYGPLLLKRPVKIFVMILFSALFILSVISGQQVQLGLDQRLALPSDSYLVDYFDALDAYLDVGPPVYFVSEGLDATHRPGQQNLCGRFSTCEDLSLANVLEAERKRSKTSFISEPAAVWVDDFLQWLNPVLSECCRVRKRDPTQFCSARDPEALCQACYEDADPPWSITMDGLPEGQAFMRYLKQWLQSPTDEDCPLGGKASYSTALALHRNTSVSASHFRTYHTPLKSQTDFINAMEAARRISDDISERTGDKVYPYSLFYVFFDQYSRIVATSAEVLFLALAAVFLVSSAMLGSWRVGALVALSVLMTIVNVIGVMGVWKVSLNAISLVNLVISIGIGVEFCSHIARAFIGAAGGGLPQKHAGGQRDRDERAWLALVDVGASVFSGIFSTKIIGVAVLGLTHSKLLETYYFRMWLSLIVAAALHGLVFLPVVLSYAGGRGFAFDNDEDLEIILSSRYGEGRPFLADSDDDDAF